MENGIPILPQRIGNNIETTPSIVMKGSSFFMCESYVLKARVYGGERLLTLFLLRKREVLGRFDGMLYHHGISLYYCCTTTALKFIIERRVYCIKWDIKICADSEVFVYHTPNPVTVGAYLILHTAPTNPQNVSSE